MVRPRWVHRLIGAVSGGLRGIRVRRSAEAGLREREEQLALFIESAPAAIAMFDREMRYLAASRRFASDHRIKAGSPADLIGRSHYEVFPGIPQRWRDIHVRVLAGETLSADADQLPHPDGRIDWVRWRMEPWRDASGAVGGALLFTEIVTALKEAEAAAKTSERLLNAVLDSLPVGVIIADAGGRILRDNAANRELWGVPPETANWEKYGDWVGYRPETGERIKAEEWALARALLKGEVVRDELVECERFDTGERRLYLNNAAPVRDASGAIAGGVVVELDVTERFAAEARMARQAALLDQAQEAILAWEIGGGITYWNRGAETLYGYDRREALGQVSHALLKTTPLLPEKELAARLEREGAWSGELVHTTRDGRILTVESSMVLMREPDGRRVVLETNRDMTERKRAEVALREALIRLDAAKKASRLGVYDFDIPADRMDWDERVRELWGVPADEVIAYEGFMSGIRPEDRPATNAAVARALDPAGDGEYAAEYRVVNRKDGSERWIAATGRTFFENGKPVRLIGTVADVTARREAENALAAKEAQLRTILETVPVGIVLGEMPSGRVIQGNSHVEAMLRHPVLPSADIDSYDEWVSYHADGTRVSGHEYPFARMILGDEDAPEIEVHYQSGDGTRRWIRIMGRPVRDSSGAMIGAVAALIDIDVERRAREALNRTAEDLERLVQQRTAQLVQAQKMEVVGQLSGGMAHDFNNLLQGIGSCLAVLDPHVPDGNLRTLFNAAQEAIQRGARLTQSMLAFARRQMLAPKPTDPAALFEGMRPLLERSLGGLIRIVIEVVPGTGPALADPAQLESAILNLAINARDAMVAGGQLILRAINVTVSRPGEGGSPSDLAPGDYVAVSMTDTGCGMDPATLTRVFEPFFTTKEVGRGSGLGLSMVHGMAAQSGGGVTIASVVGQGTTVTLYLPRVQAAAKPAAPPPPATTRGEGRVVLLVDDDALVRAGVMVGLEGAGYRVLEADDGPSALALLRDGAVIDALVTDYAMPGMTGVALIAEARRLVPSAVTVLITGYADKPDGVDPDSVLHKPFTPKDLASHLARVLGAGRPDNVIPFTNARTPLA